MPWLVVSADLFVADGSSALHQVFPDFQAQPPLQQPTPRSNRSLGNIAAPSRSSMISFTAARRSAQGAMSTPTPAQPGPALSNAHPNCTTARVQQIQKVEQLYHSQCSHCWRGSPANGSMHLLRQLPQAQKLSHAPFNNGRAKEVTNRCCQLLLQLHQGGVTLLLLPLA